MTTENHEDGEARREHYAAAGKNPTFMKQFSDPRGGAKVFIHNCVVCGAEASFAYGYGRDKLGTWYCRDHRPDRVPAPEVPA